MAHGIKYKTGLYLRAYAWSKPGNVKSLKYCVFQRNNHFVSRFVQDAGHGGGIGGKWRHSHVTKAKAKKETNVRICCQLCRVDFNSRTTLEV